MLVSVPGRVYRVLTRCMQSYGVPDSRHNDKASTTVPLSLTVTPAAATVQTLATAAPDSTPRGGETEGSGGQGGAGGTSDFGGNAADKPDATAESESDSSHTGTGTGTDFGGSPAPPTTTEGPTCTVGTRATSIATTSPSGSPICAGAAADAETQMELGAIWVVVLVAVVVLIAGWGTLVLRRRRSANSQARDLFKEKLRATSRKSRAASRHWDRPASPGGDVDASDASCDGVSPRSASDATPTYKYQGSSVPNPTFDRNAVGSHIAQPVQYQIPMATEASASPTYAAALDPADDDDEGGSGYIQVEAFSRGPGGPIAPVISTAPLPMYRVVGATAHTQVATAGPNVYDQRSSEPQQQAAGASGSYSVLTLTTSLRDAATTHVYDQRVADGMPHVGAVPGAYGTLSSKGAHPTKTTGSGVTVYDVRRETTPQSDLPPVPPNFFFFFYTVLAPQLRAAPAAARRYASLERNASVPPLVDYPAVYAGPGGAIATVNPEVSTMTAA